MLISALACVCSSSGSVDGERPTSILGLARLEKIMTWSMLTIYGRGHCPAPFQEIEFQRPRALLY